jgi:hypothetical protein
MYVVWKQRPLKGHQRCEACGNGGPGRLALVPHLVESRRVGGVPRQAHISRLPSVRSCCLRSERSLKAWRARVDEALVALRRARVITDHEARELLRRIEERAFAAASGANRQSHGPRAARPDAGNGCPRYLSHSLQLLRLDWPCRPEEAKAAFRRRAKETHPDVGGRAEEFRAVAEAYALVSSALAGPLR